MWVVGSKFSDTTVHNTHMWSVLYSVHVCGWWDLIIVIGLYILDMWSVLYVQSTHVVRPHIPYVGSEV